MKVRDLYNTINDAKDIMDYLQRAKEGPENKTIIIQESVAEEISDLFSKFITIISNADI